MRLRQQLESTIARTCGCHHEEVGRVIASLSQRDSEASKPGKSYTSKHGTPTTMDTTNIGHTRQKNLAPLPSPIPPSRRECPSLTGNGFQ